MASQRVRVCVVEYNWYLFSRVGETGRESQRKYEREREREGRVKVNFEFLLI